MRKLMIIFLSLLLCLGFVSCKKITYVDFVELMRVSFDAGILENGLYKNDEIGISFVMPDSNEYINELYNYSDSLPDTPYGYKYAARSVLFQSSYEDNTPYINVVAYYTKYPDAKKYDSANEILNEIRDDAIRYAVSQYRGDWKEKYILTEISTGHTSDIEYEYYSVNHVESDAYFFLCLFQHKDYYFTVKIGRRGTYPEEASVDNFMSGIKIYD